MFWFIFSKVESLFSFLLIDSTLFSWTLSSVSEELFSLSSKINSDLLKDLLKRLSKESLVKYSVSLTSFI